MATQTSVTKLNNGTAQWAVEADAVFCVLLGLLLFLDANGMSQFMGVQSSSVVGILGAVTILYGLGLFYDVFKELVNARLLRVLMILDFVGMIATIAFLILAPTALNTGGRWFVLILADVMGAFGIWKVIGLRRLTR
jgi:hypothetical protein